MIKKCAISTFFIVFFCQIACAKAIPPVKGTINSFFSANKNYSIDIKILGYPDNNPSECTFKEGEKIRWVKTLATTPGLVEISNDGKYFICANWGWYDEGGYKSISFYSGDGELLKTIDYGSKLRFRWIQKTCISGDSNYYIAADPFKDSSRFSLFYVPAQKLIWDNVFGLSHIDNILMSQRGDYILISTFDSKEYNINFSYLNRSGELLWEKKINKGFTFNKDLIWLSGDGLNFRIFVKDSNDWQNYENQNGKVVSKSTASN